MFYTKTLILLLSALSASKAQSVINIFSLNGDVNIAFLIQNCSNGIENRSYTTETLIHSAIWTSQRINFLDLVSPIKFGLSVFETCSESDILKTAFNVSQNDKEYFPAIVTYEKLSGKVQTFCNVLDITTKVAKKYHSYLVKAAVKFLNAAGWRENISVVTTDETILDRFYLYSKESGICIKECHVIVDGSSVTLNVTNDPLVFFGTAMQVNRFIKDQHFIERYAGDLATVVFVPLDGDVPSGLPEGSFLVLPSHTPSTRVYKTNVNILPSPLLFEIAGPLLSFAIRIKKLIHTNCNDTDYKIKCLRNKLHIMDFSHIFTPSTITKTLKIEPLEEHFVYDIFQIEGNKSKNSTLYNTNVFLKPFRKILTYNIFYENLTLIDENLETPFFNQTLEIFVENICSHRFFVKRNNMAVGKEPIIFFRTESWIYAFLSLSLLGVLFCFIILTFLVVSICQRNILEGNPVLTLLLLFAVTLIFCSTLPFSIQNMKHVSEKLCIAKSLSISLSYAAVFSLLLSRCILLGTASKEIGFMSHIAGPVQSFLCLFIFGVQAALSLQVIGKCYEIFKNNAFVYLMSYNIMLLLLLFCLTPLVYKSQRNYREGKYFTIAIILITLVWCIWVPCFVLLTDDWKEFMICFGLVSTGGICLGSIFIPRTYLMTIAAERNKITSALPSFATATSVVDLYRANTQPIYDCVNVAAINAAAVARAGVIPSAPTPNLQQPDLYSCPALPDDMDFDFRSDSPTNTDKVTRF